MAFVNSAHVRRAMLLVVLGGAMHLAAAGGMVRKESGGKTKSSLQSALQGVIADVSAERLIEVEAGVRSTYEAFPKNDMGQIPPRGDIFAAVVRNYFAREHGWVIKGLEPPHPDFKLTEVHEAHVLHSQAPRLATALKYVYDSNRGLSLTDIVQTIAALECLILDQSQELLKGACAVNGLHPEAEEVREDGLDEDTFHEVLRSYLLLLRQGQPYNFTDVRRYLRMKQRAMGGADWDELVEFERGAASAARAGGSGRYSFDEVKKVVRALALKFGRWQHHECAEMKTTLMGLDEEGSGSVPFDKFHREPAHPSFQFSESAEFLRKNSMLDDSDEGSPKVLLANYLLGPSNCIASSEYYYVCCLNECEGLVAELEHTIQMPFVPVEDLLGAVGRLPSDSVAAPREIPDARADQLRSVASQHGNVVPLHSAGFKQWLHGAYPNECPMPTAVESAAEDSEMPAAQRWLDAQEQCTRLPEWHPTMHGEKLVSV